VDPTFKANKLMCSGIRSMSSTNFFMTITVLLEEMETQFQITTKLTIVEYTGNPLTLRCSFNPHGWLKDGGDIPNHIAVFRNILIISETAEKDSGIYVCTIMYPNEVLQEDIFEVLIGG